MDKLNSWFKWAIFGGILGGVIAIIGYWIMQPQTDSVILFVLLRVAVGAIIAMIIGPIFIKNKSK